MTERSDTALLEDWSAKASEGAFAELARRYGGLLYHAAIRRTGRGDLAAEAAQNALLILARKAPRLGRIPSLAGWLHRTVCYEAAKLLRRERRHDARMKKLPPPDESDGNDPSWPEAAPWLDQALDALPEKDRQVIFLRYFQGLSFEQMARQFGGEAAAWRQRGSRAVERLRLSLTKRGVAVSSSALATGLGTTFSQGLPASVLATLSASPAAGAAALSWPSLAAHTLHFMKLHPATWIVVTLLLSVPLLIMQAVSNGSTRQRVADLESSVPAAVATSNALGNVRPASAKLTLLSLAEQIHRGNNGLLLEKLQAERRIEAMSEDELEELLLATLSLELPREKRQPALEKLFIQYAFRKSPKVAIEKVLRLAAILSDRLGTEGQQTVWAWAGVRVKEWAAAEPEKALAWYREELKAGRLDSTRLNLSIPGSIYTALRKKSPDEAEIFYRAMNEDERGSVMNFFNLSGSPEEFVDRAAEFADPSKRQQSLLMLFQYGTKGKSPAEVREWLDRSKAGGKEGADLLAIAAEGPPYREKEGSSYRSAMIMTAPEIAGRIAWLRDPALGEMSAEAIGALLAGTMKSSPLETKKVLNEEWEQHPDEEMLAAYISRAGSSFPGVIDALRRSWLLHDPEAREGALRQLMQGGSLETVREAIRGGILSAEEIEELQLPAGLIR